MTITDSLSPVVMYHGLARRYLLPSRFLLRPLLNGSTLGGPTTERVMRVDETDDDLIRGLLPLWYATRAWGEVLLCHAFDLVTASDIVRLHPKGVRRQVGNSNWYVRTHGIGVDIDGGLNRGGLDFDFDKPDPDPDRLLLFAERQINAGNISVAHYLPLVDDEDRFRAAAGRVLEGLPATNRGG